MTIDNYQTVLNGLMAKLPAENQPSIKTALAQLKTASHQLAQGSDALVDGLTLFKSKGLDKISSVLNDTVKKDVDTTQELVDLANDYKTFADSKDGVEAKTKFIMIIDSKSKK